MASRGFYYLSTKGFNYQKYDREIFFQDKPRQPYKPQTLAKYISIIKAITVSNLPYSLYKKGLIKKFDVDELKLSLFTKQKALPGTRIQHNLRKEEIDHLLHFNFTSPVLAHARDMFIMQVFAGGLRGFKEYSTLKLLKDGISFYQNKTDKHILNPFNCYSKLILDRHNGKIPTIAGSNNVDHNEQVYRERLRQVALESDMSREVLTNGHYEQICSVFNPYWARKTFGTILYHHLNLREEEIALFTGHYIKGKSELLHSYIETGSVEHKRRLLQNLQIGS